MVLEDLAREADVSPRTLQNAFHDYFGAPVHRFLHLRNLQKAHRQLAEADADETTVTTVAMHLGFWELGRFAQEYRAVYGERPSDTLRRQQRSIT
jgi:AraC-like DNA-binding protein